MEMSIAAKDDVAVDPDVLRDQVRKKYREVATDPHGEHHFHTGRYLAAQLGYDEALVASLPDAAAESFAGVPPCRAGRQGGRCRHDRGDVGQGAFDMPVEDAWADAVISNGVINLCVDKRAVFSEIHRVLRPGGWLQFADIANGNPVPAAALNNVDLWTA